MAGVLNDKELKQLQTAPQATSQAAATPAATAPTASPATGAAAPALQFLLHGPGGGVVPSACAAGHDQGVHNHFTLAFSRASRLACSRMQITAAMMVKPICTPGSTGSSHITAVATR